jgi:alpha-D-xyloside xylohydrolase
MSTRGYGMYVNTSNALGFRVGELEHTTMSVTVDDAPLLDCYLLYGPTLKEILPRYTAVTGQPGVPPKWSFGLWMARISYNRQGTGRGRGARPACACHSLRRYPHRYRLV